MAFEDPIQWIVIGIVIIALLLWGPGKIPELAKSLGLAKKEFDDAQKAWQNPTETLLQHAPPLPPNRPQTSADDVILQAAKSLGIATEGKTREQMASEIVTRAAPKNQDTRTRQAINP